eukprot:CAMPEP_0197827370 /NCGR_PEP_ID=MMETSP1437-20131217/4159_1 /TAXON_ID=49252 ORGANISM="Eucampia antarctica, Strain CCMP1452" /NCGR_SAMPLE_ID=MMETSP1437 /ASSEMBLY_ACC=CAM_ASM_001096 /LENGTH=2087 /DNA_ID=CAMNT_0043428183 /DNA_START=30 /DNA_END=6293 /DNA_ORIENTATION=+
MEEEILFPRGRPTPKDPQQKAASTADNHETSTKKKKRTRSDSGDFLFGGTSSSKELIGLKGKKSKSKKRDEDNAASSRNDNVSMMPLGGGAVLPPLSTDSGSKRPALIESLSFTKLAKGMKLLGMVREVSDEYAVISLPNMWTGFLVRKKNGVPLTRVVSIDQVLPFIVQKTTAEQSSQKNTRETPKRRIELSVDPIHINVGLTGIPNLEAGRHIRGVVSSCEDHGCLVDIGIARVQCFLSYDQIEGGKYRLLSDTDDNDSVDEESDKVDGSKVTWKLNKGRVYDFTILSLPSNDSAGAIIQLSLQSTESRCKHLTTQAVLPSANPTLRTLLPGMLVTVCVEQYAKNGLCVSFLDNVFRGAIDMAGLGGFYTPDLFSEDAFSKPKSGTKRLEETWFKKVFSGKFRFVKARIIVVDHVSKIIRLSLQSHILHSVVPEKSTMPPVGTVIENAKVIRLDNGIGALIALPSTLGHAMEIDDEDGDDETEKVSKKKKSVFTDLQRNEVYAKASRVKCCYVHISKAMDETNDEDSKKKKKKGNDTFRTPETLFAKHFGLNTTIPKLRILNTSHWMDNIASCATAESIVSAAVLSHADISPGVTYKSVPVISTLTNGSLLVQLGIGVKGIVPTHHLFDKAHMAEAANAAGGFGKNARMDKFKVGNLIDVRCLTVSLQDKKCVLTTKKTLLSSDLGHGEPILDYASIVEGKIATGFISKVDKSGIFVTFYNNVYGRVSARRLAEELGVEDPTVNYKLGDIAKARVVKCFKMNHSQDDDIDDDDVNKESYYSLELSMNTVALSVNANIDDKMKTNSINLKPGSVLLPKSMKIVELVPSKELATESSTNQYVPGYAVVSIKSKFLDLSDDNEAHDTNQTVNCKLPFDQLLDHYDDDLISTSESLDALSMRILKVGKKIAQKGIILTSGSSSRNGLPVVSLRPALIETAQQTAKEKTPDDTSGATDEGKKKILPSFLLPSPSTSLYVGANVHGYCIRQDSRYGAFVRFLDNLTGLIPKVKGGLDIPLYDTIHCKVIALDIIDGKSPKILLKQISKSSKAGRNTTKKLSIKPGDMVGDVKLEDINFARVKVTPLQKKFSGSVVRARIHITMAEPTPTSKSGQTLMPLSKGSKDKSSSTEGNDSNHHEKEKITYYHPFHTWKIGGIIKDTFCASVDERDGIYYLELTNRKPTTSNNDLNTDASSPLFVEKASKLQPGTLVTGVITSISAQNKGIWIQVCPGVSGFISGLELSKDATILNNMSKYYKVGGRICCCVMEKQKSNNKKKYASDTCVQLSALLYQEKNKSESSSGFNFKVTKPLRGDLHIARVNRFIKSHHAPSLMLDLRGNFQCRCDITELDEVGDWVNMPLGREILANVGIEKETGPSSRDNSGQKNIIVTDEEQDTAEELKDDDDSDEEQIGSQETGLYRHGTFVNCRILSSGGKSNPYLEVSLRQSRIDGGIDDVEPPKEKEMVRAYVVRTTKKGCFVRLSRTVEGRVILKELSDSFLPNPVVMFPSGRLVVGKVRAIRDVKKKSNNSSCKYMVDLDMRESKLLENQDKIDFQDIKLSEKYPGVVTRVEEYGVFVRLENSDVNGLSHISECSDDYIKNISSLYDPGDLVKVFVTKINKDKKQVSLSLKASHFEDDSDSDDDSSSESSEEEDSEMPDIVTSENESDIDSDDDNFASKLAAKMEADEGSSDEGASSNEDASDDDSSEEGSSDDDSSEDGENQKSMAMDTDVGFDWGNNASTETKTKNAPEKKDSDSDSSSDESSDEDEVDTVGKSSHKSRKKAAAKRQTEKEILVRESALADGTADENPETTSDFERILASDPNSSENYIRYMAYHLSLADIESARSVADRAFDRIEFRQEGEKLNVWTALLTLEMKYGNQKKFSETIDRSCQHNNPKQVYLRVCEMLEREIDKADQSQVVTATTNADDVFSKMCKKFKSKKTVWISHLNYLLKFKRHEEAHALLKKALTSLPEYKHVETMSKFAQQEYEHGSVERARTIFDALVEKQKKRLDLLFVYVDKEIKHGEIQHARNIFEKISKMAGDKNTKSRFNDKQMKGLFKKWYRMEDEHGDDESRQNVKLTAKAYVERSTS